MEYINKEIHDLKNAQSVVKENTDSIRKKFIIKVIVFIDMVGSTDFKVANSEHPEIWILRLWDFCEVVSNHVKAFNGRVIKYIGDEVMASFEGDCAVQHSLGFISAHEKMEKDVEEKCGHKTQLKIAIDLGNVYDIKYEGHSEPDPQGTPVDRAARISKYCDPQTILASHDYVSAIDKNNDIFKFAGTPKAKGLGEIKVYQFKTVSIDIEGKEKGNISVSELSNLQTEYRKLKEICSVYDEEAFRQSQIIRLDSVIIPISSSWSINHWGSNLASIKDGKMIFKGEQSIITNDGSHTDLTNIFEIGKSYEISCFTKSEKNTTGKFQLWCHDKIEDGDSAINVSTPFKTPSSEGETIKLVFTPKFKKSIRVHLQYIPGKGSIEVSNLRFSEISQTKTE